MLRALWRLINRSELAQMVTLGLLFAGMLAGFAGMAISTSGPERLMGLMGLAFLGGGAALIALVVLGDRVGWVGGLGYLLVGPWLIWIGGLALLYAIQTVEDVPAALGGMALGLLTGRVLPGDAGGGVMVAAGILLAGGGLFVIASQVAHRSSSPRPLHSQSVQAKRAADSDGSIIVETLEDARKMPGETVVLHGDYGGHTYLTVPAALVTRSEAELAELLRALDACIWDNERGAEIWYTRSDPGPDELDTDDEFPNLWVDGLLRHPMVRGIAALLPGWLRGDENGALQILETQETKRRFRHAFRIRYPLEPR